MANEQNLKSYKPGQSGNPAGKPPGTRDGLRACLNRKLREKPNQDALAILESLGARLEGVSNADVLASVLIEKASSGDTAAAKLIADQTERPLPKEINLTGGSGEPLDLNWTVNIVKAKELEE